MNAVIQEYGKNNGYLIILNDRVLLYGDETEDLTEKIIKILNDNYTK
jgi:Skp family chaperone for outer membrane proteins